MKFNGNIPIQSVAMRMKSSRPFNVKMTPIHHANGNKQMTPIENRHQGMNITAFLNASRQYLALGHHASASPRLSVVASTSQRTSMTACRKAVRLFLLAAGVGAFAAGPVMADPGCDHRMGHADHHEKMMEQHHNHLHDALKLSAEQEPGWKKLMESESPGAAISGGQREDWAKLNAPERAERMLELAKVRQARMADHVAALKAFYATLTPEQQKTFEAFHTGPRGRMAGKPGPKAQRADKPANKD
jgi:Spy/CpxP family protein refolding chaperone